MPNPARTYWVEIAFAVGMVLLFLLLVIGTKGACDRLYDRAKTTQDTLIIATSRSGCSLPEADR